VRKGNAELVTRLNQALRQILADGTYAEIRTQYFDFDIYGSEVAMTHPPHAADGQEPNGR
jgi:ABC-type amino acid transport substrate-binding protein